MTRLKPHLIPFLLFFLSFALRLSLISKGPYHADCLTLAINAEKTLETLTLHPLFGPGYPLTVILGAAFVFVLRVFSLNDPVFAVNLMSVLFSSLCIPTLYYVVKKIFDSRAAVLSSVTFSIFPSFLAVSVYGKSHSPSLFFLLLGLCFLLSYQANNKKYLLWLSALSLGLLGATRLQDLFLMGLPLSFLLLSDKEGKIDKSPRQTLIPLFVQFWGLALAVVCFFHLPFLLQETQKNYGDQFLRFWQYGITENFLGLFSKSLIFSFKFFLANLTPLGFLLALAGIVRLFKSNFRLFIFLLMWILCTLLFYGNLNSTVPRMLILSSIPLIIAQGYYLAGLLNRDHKVLNKIVLIAFWIMLALLFHKIHPILLFRHDNALLPDCAKIMSQWTPKNARIITADENLFFYHYGKRLPLNRPRSHFPYTQRELNEFKKRVDTFIGNEIPVYITNSGLYNYDANKQFSKFIKANYTLTFTGKHLSEDWHRGGTRLMVGQEMLFKIEIPATP